MFWYQKYVKSIYWKIADYYEYSMNILASYIIVF